MNNVTILAILYLGTALAGYIGARVGLPLPWLIGPLTLTAILSITGVLKITVPTKTRPFGQITVATFIGAQLSPDALHSLLSTAPLLLAVSVFVIAAALSVALLQRRLFGTETATALLAVMPTSPVEAGVQAERLGLNPAPIVLAQTIRIAVVVTAIPILLQLGSHTGGLPPVPPHKDGILGVAITLAGALLGPVLFRAFNSANPFFLGPLFVAAVLAGLNLPTYQVPGPILAVAQIVLGTWLGSSLRRDLFVRGGSLIWAIMLSTGLLLSLCAVGGWLLSRLFHIPFATVMLGIAPGGVTEMALTAGVLGQDVALVTAMHITRIFTIMPNLGWMIRLFRPKPPKDAPKS